MVSEKKVSEEKALKRPRRIKEGAHSDEEIKETNGKEKNEELSEDGSKKLEELLSEEEISEDIRESPVRSTGLIMESKEPFPEVQNLENSLEGAPLNKWEERHKKPSEDKFYNESAERDDKEKEDRREDHYRGGFDMNLYEESSGIYVQGADKESKRFYDPRIKELSLKDEVRQADKSELEITGLQAGFGKIPEEKLKDKNNKKYKPR